MNWTFEVTSRSAEVWKDHRVHIPLIVAHRGASAAEAEHTKAAYELALQVGADGVETDVRLTSDRQLVCIHDRSVDRTSSGTGIVSSLTAEQLAAFDWAAGAGLADGVRGRRRAELLTLEILLDTIADDARATPLLTLIETKHPSRFGGLVERELAALLRARGLADGPAHGIDPVVMSFSPTAVTRMRRLAPRLPLVYLIEKGKPSASIDGSLPSGVTRVGLDVGFLQSTHKVKAHRRRGHTIFVWTVDERPDVERCLEQEVDVIITNRPAEVRAMVAELAH